MIITVRRDLLNDKVSTSLGISLKTDTVRFFSPRAKKTEDKHLIVLDLTATGQFQKIYTAENLLKKLEEHASLERVEIIDFYASDVLVEDPREVLIPVQNLLQIAEELAYGVKQKYGTRLQVRVITDYHSDITLLVPPSEDSGEKWQVFGIDRKEFPEKFEVNFSSLLALKEKKLIWEGAELNDWLSQCGHVFEPLTVDEVVSACHTKKV